MTGSVATFAAVALGAVSLAEHAALYRARHDPLTGVPTRALWTARASRAMRRPSGLVIVLVDGDGIKTANDTRGHGAGDALIGALAHRLGRWAGAGHVGRLGGDEFAGYVRLDGGVVLGERLDALCQSLARPVRHGGVALPASASVGAVLVDDLPIPALSAALRTADAGMYLAKCGGRDGWHVADLGLDPSASRRAGGAVGTWPMSRRGGIPAWCSSPLPIVGGW